MTKSDKTNTFKVNCGKYEITVTDEPTYSLNSTDNVRTYDYEYCRCNDSQNVSAHGIHVIENGELISSAIVLGVGGATTVTQYSLAYDGSCVYVAAGDALFSLSIPHLHLNWVNKVDFATCFGVFWLNQNQRLLTWGELEIGCYSGFGEKLWSASGRDIFTGGIEISGNTAKVVDFNGDVYEINLSNGEISG